MYGPHVTILSATGTVIILMALTGAVSSRWLPCSPGLRTHYFHTAYFTAAQYYRKRLRYLGNAQCYLVYLATKVSQRDPASREIGGL
jgi:hypothetical protein